MGARLSSARSRARRWSRQQAEALLQATSNSKRSTRSHSKCLKPNNPPADKDEHAHSQNEPRALGASALDRQADSHNADASLENHNEAGHSDEQELEAMKPSQREENATDAELDESAEKCKETKTSTEQVSGLKFPLNKTVKRRSPMFRAIALRPQLNRRILQRSALVKMMNRRNQLHSPLVRAMGRKRQLNKKTMKPSRSAMKIRTEDLETEYVSNEDQDCEHDETEQSADQRDKPAEYEDDEETFSDQADVIEKSAEQDDTSEQADEADSNGDANENTENEQHSESAAHQDDTKNANLRTERAKDELRSDDEQEDRKTATPSSPHTPRDVHSGVQLLRYVRCFRRFVWTCFVLFVGCWDYDVVGLCLRYVFWFSQCGC